MNLQELHNILEATSLPVAYSHFTETENEPLPIPPFIAYLVTYSSNLYADNQVYKQVQNAQIELYTKRKDLEAEAILEELLNQNELPFYTTEIYISSEQIYQKIYEVRLF